VKVPVSALILDLDGTLLDHVGSVTAALNAWIPTLGTPATDALINAWLDAEQRHFPAWRSREVTFAEQRRRRLRDFLPLLGISPGEDKNMDTMFSGLAGAMIEAGTPATEEAEIGQPDTRSRP
jgi:putative hydrolase of the HAD superfamily